MKDFIQILLLVVIASAVFVIGVKAKDRQTAIQEDVSAIMTFLEDKTIYKVDVWEKTPVYYNNIKVNGDCALVKPPCWENFYRNVLRLKADPAPTK